MRSLVATHERRGRSPFSTALVGVAGLLGTTVVPAAASTDSGASLVTRSALRIAPPLSITQSPDTLVELAARASRAVVRIDVQIAGDERQGSGFLIDDTGRILTNQHVIRDAEGLRIKLASGDVYDHVQILAVDERRDMAVLQIAGFDLPSLPLGNSDSTRIGNPVVLIGSPLGLENTVTTGIVSGRRNDPDGYQLLQISAPASVGSSGGPVLSRDGRVVAIASSQLPSGQNLNFALPINYARGILAHLTGEPVAVLTPDATQKEVAKAPLAAASNAVNQGLHFDLHGFHGYSFETQVQVDEDSWQRTRVTYRIIETVGGGRPLIERYLEGETKRRAGPLEAPQTLHRERVRTLVGSASLEPVSTRRETANWTGEAWEESSYDLRFEGTKVRGVIRDSDGETEELDRDLPPGVILREIKHLAFGMLQVGDLVGRSVELVTFDAAKGMVTSDRYDVRGFTQFELDGTQYDAYRVNVASGLTNTEAYFQVAPPRLLLQQESGSEGGIVEVTEVEVFAPLSGGN